VGVLFELIGLSSKWVIQWVWRLLYFSKQDPSGNITFLHLRLKLKPVERYRPPGPLVIKHWNVFIYFLQIQKKHFQERIKCVIVLLFQFPLVLITCVIDENPTTKRIEVEAKTTEQVKAISDFLLVLWFNYYFQFVIPSAKTEK